MSKICIKLRSKIKKAGVLMQANHIMRDAFEMKDNDISITQERDAY